MAKVSFFYHPESKQMLNKLFTAELPVKTAFKILKLKKEISAENERAEEIRMKIVEKYKKEDAKEENMVLIDPEKMIDFSKEMDELFALDFSVTEQLSENDVQTLKLSVNELQLLVEHEILNISDNS